MSKISVTTIAGLTSGGDANTVKIESGDDFVVDTNVLKVDSSNNRVGIGTASPSQDLTIVNSGSARMELISGTSGTSIIDMGDSADGDIGGIRYLQSSDRLHFRAGNDVRVSIDSDGLKFGSDTAAANALDDYEEGSHTITFTNIAANPTSQSSTYTKIGNVVNYIGTLQFPSTSDSNNVNISLPFVSSGRNGIGTFLSNGANDKILFTAGSGTNFMRVYPDNAFSQNNYNSFSTMTFYFTITYQTTA